MLVPPSPKFHVQEVGVPAEASVKFTTRPGVPNCGEAEKFALIGRITTSPVFVNGLLEPEALVAVSDTL